MVLMIYAYTMGAVYPVVADGRSITNMKNKNIA